MDTSSQHAILTTRAGNERGWICKSRRLVGLLARRSLSRPRGDALRRGCIIRTSHHGTQVSGPLLTQGVNYVYILLI